VPAGLHNLIARAKGHADTSVEVSGGPDQTLTLLLSLLSSLDCSNVKCPEHGLERLNFCSPCCKCSLGEGDCNDDNDCLEGLQCAEDVGRFYGFDNSVDVCEVKLMDFIDSDLCEKDCTPGCDNCERSGWKGCSNRDQRIFETSFPSIVELKQNLSFWGYHEIPQNSTFDYGGDYARYLGSCYRFQALVRPEKYEIYYIEGPEPDPEPHMEACYNNPWSIAAWHENC